MNSLSSFQTRNCEPVPLSSIPVLDSTEFLQGIVKACAHNNRICSLFCAILVPSKKFLFAVIGDDTSGTLHLSMCPVENQYQSITNTVPQAHLFEREIFEQYGIYPEGHPWCKPVRFQNIPFENSTNRTVPLIGNADFFALDHSQMHEVAVGPVHAGVIEPGHFRFQCHGEQVHHLEISLGYQHRGIEEALVKTDTMKKHLYFMETLAGDTTIGHTAAYCRALESLTECIVTTRSHTIRAIAAELERCANHAGDLGALAGDVGYLPVQSFCGRIRGDFLNLSALLCGNRFGRGLLHVGGVNFDLDESTIEQALNRLASVEQDINGAADLLFNEPTVQGRFQEVGILSQEQCVDLGIVGPAARASGLIRDVRQDYSYGIYRFMHIPVVSGVSGDIFDRAMVRWREIQESIEFIRTQLQTMPEGQIHVPQSAVLKEHVVVSLTEGWRGEICHVCFTNDRGTIQRYKIVDPSFHNWTGLSLALRQMQISDFPLCNKSFNLSYCGFDL